MFNNREIKKSYAQVRAAFSVFPRGPCKVLSDVEKDSMNELIEKCRNLLQENRDMSLCAKTRRLMLYGSRFWRCPAQGNVLIEDIVTPELPSGNTYYVHLVADCLPSEHNGSTVPGPMLDGQRSVILMSLKARQPRLQFNFPAPSGNSSAVRLHRGNSMPYSLFARDDPAEDNTPGWKIENDRLEELEQNFFYNHDMPTTPTTGRVLRNGSQLVSSGGQLFEAENPGFQLDLKNPLKFCRIEEVDHHPSFEVRLVELHPPPAPILPRRNVRASSPAAVLGEYNIKFHFQLLIIFLDKKLINFEIYIFLENPASPAATAAASALVDMRRSGLPIRSPTLPVAPPPSPIGTIRAISPRRLREPRERSICFCDGEPTCQFGQGCLVAFPPITQRRRGRGQEPRPNPVHNENRRRRGRPSSTVAQSRRTRAYSRSPPPYEENNLMGIRYGMVSDDYAANCESILDFNVPCSSASIM